jgi:hypothetical protein
MALPSDPTPGLVSSRLEEELREALRQYGIIVWLDKDAHYTAFVERLAARAQTGQFFAPVVAYRGSFLELLFELERHGSELEKHPLLIHMPGHNEQTIRKTPVLELYEAGFRYRKALDTLVREVAAGRVAPDEVTAFLAEPGLSLDDADRWLDLRLRREQEGLAGLLEQMGPELLADELLGEGSFLTPRLSTAGERQTLLGHLRQRFGLTNEWLTFITGESDPSALESLRLAVWAWILSVEYVHDLRRPPRVEALQPLPALPPAIVEVCKKLAVHLRKQHAQTYAQRADEIELRLAGEREQVRPEDLGRIDTFRFEETAILTAAIAAVRDGHWSQALAWATGRIGDDSFWLGREQARKWTWSLVEAATQVDAAIAKAPRPLQGVQSFDEAVSAYTSAGAAVDRAHRRFEQKRTALLDPRLPHFSELLSAAGQLRLRYRAWADQLSRDFQQLCRDHGFLPPASLQQRTFYDQVVDPLVRSGDKVALFVIDAFRYEMATEFLDEMKSTGAHVDLRARFAELPTITSVGMNVLAPVANDGRLTVSGVLRGFRNGEFSVETPEQRARAMGMRSLGKPALRLELAEVCDVDTDSLRRKVNNAPGLIVVHSTEIDGAGEVGLGLPTFEATLQQIKSAWHHLQVAGVKQFVFTADHGFLLQDETTPEARPFGKKNVPSRRYVLDDRALAENGLVNVSLSALGYEGAPGYVLFRDDTGEFATGHGGTSFVHGGNSPQERIIPVLSVTRRREQTSAGDAYQAEAVADRDLLGQRQLKLRLVHARDSQSTLTFAATQEVELALRVPGQPKVNVVLNDVQGPAALKSGRVRVRIGTEWTHVFFALQGEFDARVPVEVYHPDSVERVQPAITEGLFVVEVTRSTEAATSKPAQPPVTQGWLEALPDDATRRVFKHIDDFNAVNETELIQMLGGARQARRFAASFDELVQRVPFRVRIESAASGKRYVKEGVK